MNRDDFDELLRLLAATPGRISQLVEGAGVEMVTYKSSDQFSILESVCHLRDIEIEGYTERITRILDETEPSLPDIDGGKLAVERDYNTQDLKQALESFGEARKRNVDRIRSLGVGQLARIGKLEGVGNVTLARLLELMVEHDEGHLEELEALQRSLRHRLT